MILLQSRKVSWGLLFVTTIIWGTSYILIKKGLVVYSPIQVALLRMVFAFLALVPFFPFAFRKVDKKLLGQVALVALTGSTLPPFLFNYAQTEISSALTGILNSMTPLFTLIIGVIFYGNRFSRKQGIGILLGLAGAVWLIWSGSEGIEGAGWIYPSLVILATICYGFGGNIVNSKLGGMNPLTITCLIFLMIGPPAAVGLSFTDFFTRVSVKGESLEALGFILILGVFGTAYALVLFNQLVHNTNALFASTVTYLIPLVAIIWGFLDGEHIELYHLLGLGFILSGVYITSRN